MNPPNTPAPDTHKNELLLTVPETAKLLRTSQWMIYKLIREDTLATIKIGSRRLIPAVDLESYVSNLRAVKARMRHV